MGLSFVPVKSSAVPQASFAWLREAARLCEASVDVADGFARSGRIQLSGMPFTVVPLNDEPGAPWHAIVQVARPEGVAMAVWCDALLTANSQIMLMTHAAFSLDAQGHALLVMRISADHHDHPVCLAADLEGLLLLVQALRDGVHQPTLAAGNTQGVM